MRLLYFCIKFKEVFIIANSLDDKLEVHLHIPMNVYWQCYMLLDYLLKSNQLEKFSISVSGETETELIIDIDYTTTFRVHELFINVTEHVL